MITYKMMNLTPFKTIVCIVFYLTLYSQIQRGEEKEDLIPVATDENGMNVGCADFRRNDGVNGIKMIV